MHVPLRVLLHVLVVVPSPWCLERVVRGDRVGRMVLVLLLGFPWRSWLVPPLVPLRVLVVGPCLGLLGERLVRGKWVRRVVLGPRCPPLCPLGRCPE